MSNAGTRALGLTSDSFLAGNPDAKRHHRVIANIQAAQKVGKDYFALSAPGPIVVLNLDQGLEGVVERFLRKGKEIIIAGMPGTGNPTRGIYPHYHFARPPLEDNEKLKGQTYLNRVMDLAEPIWKRFIRDYNEALRSKVRTIVVDTQNALYQLGQFAALGMDKPGREDDAYNKKGTQLKSIFQGLIAEGLSWDKNVLWLSREKEKWENNAPTGEMISDGYKDIGYEVQLTIRLSKRKAGGEVERLGEIRDVRESRFAKSEGTKFGGSNDIPNRFSAVMAAVFGTEEEVWK